MNDPNIRINGSFTGNFQIGDHNSADYTADSSDSPELRELRAAVDELRTRLRAAEGVHEADAELAEEALEEVAAAGPPTPGRLRRAVATLTGALSSAAGLAGAVAALRTAAAPWL